MNILSVGELTRYIKNLFNSDWLLNNVMVRGEISNFKRHYSGHAYFTLKDSDASVRAVMFKARANTLKFEPKDGMKVVGCGAVRVFDRDGQYQLYIEQLIPEGVGELSVAFEQLKEKLSLEGLFDEARKRPLPMLPKTIGVATSLSGAAIRDIITVAKRRHNNINIIVTPVLVQGPDAPSSIVKGIELLNKTAGIDVLIVGRGGGSIEELWAFNDELVVRAIAASHIPVVSAVGHQTDYTLADFAADRRAATPSEAAEIAVPDAAEVSKYIRSLYSALEIYTQNKLNKTRDRLERSLSSRFFKKPELIIADKRMIIDSYIIRLEDIIKKKLLTNRHDLNLAAQKLTMLDPLATLSRGYGIVRSYDGKVIVDAGEIREGDELEIKLNQGYLDVKVLGVRKG